MVTQLEYGFSTTLELPLDEAIARTKSALKTEGFGVLTEIDVQATLREKLGVETAAQVILGACNPALAHQALQTEPEVGLLLPCNVAVRANEGMSTVSIIDPESMLGVVANPAMRVIASEASTRLQRVILQLSTIAAESDSAHAGVNS